MAKYASAENDVNYSVMRITGTKKKEYEEKKKGKLMRTFEVQRWRKVLYYYSLTDEQIIRPVASFSPGI